MVELLDWVVRGDFAGESKRILKGTIFYLKELENKKQNKNKQKKTHQKTTTTKKHVTTFIG